MSHPQVSPPIVEIDGTGIKVGIVVSRYNWQVTGAMLALAHEELTTLGVAAQDVHVVTVPGSFELATVAQAMLARQEYHALICFGCVMKGATRHDVIVSDAAAQGLQRVALDSQIPVILGVMCAENQQQAEERIPRGSECARAAVEMAQTIQQLRSHKQHQEA